MEIHGTMLNGVIVPENGAAIPDGSRVRIILDQSNHKAALQDDSSLGQRLLKHAGKVSGLPDDLAAQHDHYLHGTPKR